VIGYCWVQITFYVELHLLLRTPEPNLASGMQHWLSGYASPPRMGEWVIGSQDFLKLMITLAERQEEESASYCRQIARAASELAPKTENQV
jgi:hypothetical protein